MIDEIIINKMRKW